MPGIYMISVWAGEFVFLLVFQLRTYYIFLLFVRTYTSVLLSFHMCRYSMYILFEEPDGTFWACYQDLSTLAMRHNNLFPYWIFIIWNGQEGEPKKKRSLSYKCEPMQEPQTVFQYMYFLSNIKEDFIKVKRLQVRLLASYQWIICGRCVEMVQNIT